MVSRNSQPLPDAAVMLPPSLPPTLSRRPTLGHKRDSSYVDTDDEAGLSISAKKLKVAFDPHVDVRIMSDSWRDKSTALVQQEVQVAINKHIRHAVPTPEEDAQYNALVQMFKQDAFSDEATSSSLLQKYINHIEMDVLKMDRCGRLAIAILDLSWLGRSEAFVLTYSKFIVSLNSTYVRFLQPTLERLVSFFAYLPSALGRLPSESLVSRTVMFKRLYSCISRILDAVPPASNMLLRAIRSEYPNELASTKSYSQFQQHLVRFAEGMPELRAEILGIVIQRLVSLDVQIQQELEELDEDEEEPALHPELDMIDAEDDDSDDESVSSTEITRTEEEERRRDIRMKMEKMDATMDFLFSHYQDKVSSEADPGKDPAFLELLTTFDTYILPNRTRHAQFLIFHFAQLSQDHMSIFAQQCIERGFAGNSMAQKLSGIAYLSSFIARGARVTRNTVIQCFEVLCDYLEQMRKKHEKHSAGPDRRAYLTYYAVSQALLYIFCFRWRDLALRSHESEDEVEFAVSADKELVDSDEDLDDVLADNGKLQWYPRFKDILSNNLFCRLNPLKVCAPAIVGEFSTIARHLEFVEVLTKLESNKKIRLGQAASYYGTPGGFDLGRRETAFDRKTGDAHLQLESYFPFDPYTLRTSQRWLTDDYNEWKLPRGLRNGDDDDLSDAESEPENDDEAGNDVDDIVDHFDTASMNEEDDDDDDG